MIPNTEDSAVDAARAQSERGGERDAAHAPRCAPQISHESRARKREREIGGERGRESARKRERERPAAVADVSHTRRSVADLVAMPPAGALWETVVLGLQPLRL